MRRSTLLYFLFILAFTKCSVEHNRTDNLLIKPQNGLVISHSVEFTNDEYQLLTTDDSNNAIITIEGDSIDVNFNHLTLIGTEDLTTPNQFDGIAIHVKNSQYISIRNLNVSGYKVAVKVDKVSNLTIDSCNFSFNYREASTSKGKVKNEQITALVINNSDNIHIKNTNISNNYNGVLLHNSKNYQFENNQIQFNANTGVSIEKSSNGQFSNNQIDWNFGAGINNSDISISNIFQNNSLTHNGKINGVDEKYRNLNDFTASDIDFKIAGNTTDNIPALDPKFPKGEIYKIPTKYGIYNFEYPEVFLREQTGNKYTFSLFGPQIGNWKFVHAENIKTRSLKRGTLPAMFLLEKEDPNEPMSIQFEFIGVAFQDEYGHWNKKGKVYQFGYTDAAQFDN